MYNELVDSFRNYFENHSVIKSFELSDIQSRAVDKMQIYPIAYLDVTGGNAIDKTVTFNVTLDLLELQIDNVQFNNDLMLTVGLELFKKIQSKTAFTIVSEVESLSFEFIKNQDTSSSAGVRMNFDITLHNNLTICN